LIPAAAWAQPPDARGILQRALERYILGFEESRVVLTMVLRDKRGGRKIRRIVSRSKKKEGLLWQHACFLDPAEVKNTAFLSLERKGGQDDQYLWLPGQGRLRRITASQRSGSFMGSDFSYRDLEKRDVDDGVHRVGREESIGGHECWVIESVPRPGADDVYTRTITWVRKRDDFPIRTKFFGKEGEHEKTLFVREVGRTDGRPYAKRMRMVDVKKRHATYLNVDELDLQATIPDEMFTPAYLGRGQECAP
jgi:hypothetical protein